MPILKFDPADSMSNAIYQAFIKNYGEDRSQKILEAAFASTVMDIKGEHLAVKKPVSKN